MNEPSNPLRSHFMRWQCRVRQLAMRDSSGHPDDAIMPSLILGGQQEPLGHIITLLSKSEVHSKTPEMQHLFRQTYDPAKQREKAISFLMY